MKTLCSSILDQRSHIGRQLIEHVIHRPPGKMKRRLCGAHEDVEVREGNERISEGDRDLGVDLADPQGRLLHGQLRHIHGHTEAAVTGLVRRRNLDNGYVNGICLDSIR